MSSWLHGQGPMKIRDSIQRKFVRLPLLSIPFPLLLTGIRACQSSMCVCCKQIVAYEACFLAGGLVGALV